QWLAFGAVHDDTASFRAHVHLSKPAAPGGLFFVRAGQPARNGMLDAILRELRLERLLENAASRRCREHRCKWRTYQAHLACVIVSRSNEQCTAVRFDVAGDVIVVEKLQD